MLNATLICFDARFLILVFFGYIIGLVSLALIVPTESIADQPHGRNVKPLGNATLF
jgi:hypothetical protein